MSQVIVPQTASLVRDNFQPFKAWAAEFWDEAVTFVQPKQFGWFEEFSKNRIVNRFGRIQDGCIELQHANSTDVLGNENSQDRVTIGVHHARFYSRVLLGGTIGAADSYIANEWSTNDLTGLIRILIRNLGPMGALEQTWGRLKRSAHWFSHQLRKNTRSGSRKNIHEHYDLGNSFYELFLDPTMNYSCGIFESERSTMLDASLAKMERICQKLELCADDHVVEIGTGWAGLATYMAENYGCRVTTTTISREQYDFAQKIVAQKGLQDRVQVIQKDYRDLEGSFDKLVSIEMIEAVGYQYFDQYFQKCSSLLKPEGLMLIQAITMSEQNFDRYRQSVDFIRSHVFPGGCLPSLAAINQSVGRATDLRMVHLEDLTEHYATTLRAWRLKFHERLEKVRALGFDDAFLRLWHFYLCYCEAGFAERRIHLVQTSFAKPGSPFDAAQRLKCVGK